MSGTHLDPQRHVKQLLFHVWPKITLYGRKWQEIFFKINTTITLSCDVVFQRIGSQLKN